MKQTPRLGLQGEQIIVVGPANRISFADARMPAVLATPWLIAHLEYAARQAVYSGRVSPRPDGPCLGGDRKTPGRYDFAAYDRLKGHLARPKRGRS